MRYEELFKSIDTFNHGVLGSQDVYGIWTRSNLEKSDLSDIWYFHLSTFNAKD